MAPTAMTVAGIVGGVAGTALLAWPIAIWLEVRRCEKPSYVLLKRLKEAGWFGTGVELRRYAPHLVAEVTFPADTPDMRTALSGGFRQIAAYIFNSEGGQDRSGKSEKISMTSPVKAEMLDGGYKVAFVMPSKYRKAEELPRPGNPNVMIRETPAQMLAAISWRGKAPREAQVEDKKAELIGVLQKSGLKPTPGQTTHVWQYYPPFAPNWMRLNEVLLAVEDAK